MEYFTPLDALLLKLEEIPEFVKKLVHVVKKLHARDIVHNDLASANVLSQDGQIYLIDFEFSKTAATEAEKSDDIYTSIFFIIVSLYMSREEYLDKFTWGFCGKIINSPNFRFRVYTRYDIPDYVEKFYKIRALDDLTTCMK
jgi:tRNA A-37 threonylcarbamoyl transferase component Bud32